MITVQAARCAVMFWQDGKLVWDDYLRHEQLALTAESERVVRWFADWKDLDTAHALGDHAHPVAVRLLEAGVLIGRDSPADLAEQRVLAQWGAFGPAARYFHFAARTDTETRYLDLQADRAYFADKARADPPPPVAKTYPDRKLFALTENAVGQGWARPDLRDAVRERRSVRTFSADPISLAAISDLLRLTGGVVDAFDHPQLGTTLRKSSPSAGGRTPLELYLYANRVDGLEPGLYHFAPTRNGLEAIRPAIPDDVRLAALGGQPWLVDGAALVIHTAVIARTRWRYETRRAYRDILIELGHVSQTLLLTSSALGLGAVFATAVQDEALERLIGVDFTAEVALGVTSIGRPVPGA
jgi:SagB-type dehydrogenase family enzyme